MWYLDGWWGKEQKTVLEQTLHVYWLIKWADDTRSAVLPRCPFVLALSDVCRGQTARAWSYLQRGKHAGLRLGAQKSRGRAGPKKKQFTIQGVPERLRLTPAFSMLQLLIPPGRAGSIAGLSHCCRPKGKLGCWVWHSSEPLAPPYPPPFNRLMKCF